MARSLNKVLLIGNLTADPELRYTPSGKAVASFSIATNRSYTSNNETKEETEFHRIVAWDKLAEICSEYLTKGKKVYAEGRLQTRKWTDKEGNDRQTTEIVINELLMLGEKPQGTTKTQEKPVKKVEKEEVKEEEISPDDIPF